MCPEERFEELLLELELRLEVLTYGGAGSIRKVRPELLEELLG